MKEIKKENGVVVVLGNITVNQIYTNEFDGKVRASAHITQERITTYPGQRFDTGFGDGLFDNPEGQSYVSKRNTLIAVPEDATEEIVAQKISEFPESCIYRILSNSLDEVISDKEKRAVEAGFITKESLEPKYLVQDSEGNVYASTTTDGVILEGDDRKVGKIVDTEEGKAFELFNPDALLEYKRDVFSREYCEDKDNRVKVTVANRQFVYTDLVS